MKIRVLLVDDEQEFVEVLAERLEVRDIVVTKAFSGDEALAEIKEKVAPDLKPAVVSIKRLERYKDSLQTHFFRT